MKKLFEEGGKLHRLYPLYEAFESFLFVLPVKTTTGAHIRDHYDIKRMMSVVIMAGMPVLLFGMYNAGYQHFITQGIEAGIIDSFIKGLVLVLPVLIAAYAVGGFWEVLFAIVRKHEINEGLLVTGFLIPLIVPPSIPIWQVAVATTFGVIIGKEVFGGTGMNVFNPALVTRAFLFFAFPGQISGDSVWVAYADTVDVVTRATPLSLAVQSKAGVVMDALIQKGYGFWDMFLGRIPGSIGETSALLIILGGLFLAITRVGSWRIMLSVFIGGYVMGLVFNHFAPSAGTGLMGLPAHYHLVMGGFAFGAVFMATDPVSASGTNTGKFIYGLLIGVLAVIIRVLNPAYPEGVMLAILFMNAVAPLIDEIVIWKNIKRRLKRATAK